MKKVAILTSGGDAPGMNAAIRAIVLACERENIEVIGYKYGYNGLLANNTKSLNALTVHNQIQQGGTLLHSGRCLEFKLDSNAQLAASNLDKAAVDGLIVIGGDGSFRGAEHLSKHWSGNVVGIPGTIDNDIAGTDASIGFYTAVQTAVESIDKVRDTADAFERLFLVEVMGRQAGFLALHAAMASASNYVVLPELFESEEQTLNEIQHQFTLRKAHVGHASFVVVIAENVWPGGTDALCSSLAKKIDIDVRPVILGHVQRGGSPVSEDRILATKLGNHAVESLSKGKSGVMMGEQKGVIVSAPLSTSWSHKKEISNQDLSTLQTLLNTRFK